MAFGSTSWIARALVGHDLATETVAVQARTFTYGSTAGPYRGIGGAAITNFDITAVTLRGGTVLVFADEAFLGWQTSDRAAEVLARLRDGTPVYDSDLLAPAECPVALPARGSK